MTGISGTMRLPPPDASGLLEPVLGIAPSEWPWALPQLYAVNTAEECDDVVVGASAQPSGAYSEVRSEEQLGRLEVIGY